MNSGFYKYQEELFHAPNCVASPEYTLLKEEKDSYTFPHDGWIWCESLEEACEAFSLDIDKYITEETDEL